MRQTTIVAGTALISAVIAVVGIVAAVLLRPVTLRSSLDLPGTARTGAVAADAIDGAPAFHEVAMETAGRHRTGG